MHVGGRDVPPELCGELVAHDGPLTHTAVAETLEKHGYVLLRSALPVPLVEAAATEVFTALQAEDEVEPPPRQRVSTGRSNRQTNHPDLGEFWQGVCEGPALRRVSHGTELRDLVSTTMGEAARPFDLLYLRPTPRGKGTPAHADFTFFATSRADTAMLNAWVPYTPIALDEGPLMVIERTHAMLELTTKLTEIDYVLKETGGSLADANRMTEIAYRANGLTGGENGYHGMHPIDFARKHGVKLLSSTFQPGDVILLSMLLLHGACDHTSRQGLLRLSCDIRYQPAAVPADDRRFFGVSPRNSTGGGYGDMSGAQPLNAQLLPADRMEQDGQGKL